ANLRRKDGGSGANPEPTVTVWMGERAASAALPRPHPNHPAIRGDTPVRAAGELSSFTPALGAFRRRAVSLYFVAHVGAGLRRACGKMSKGTTGRMRTRGVVRRMGAECRQAPEDHPSSGFCFWGRT